MDFGSVLYETPEAPVISGPIPEPTFFRDLNLDHVVADMTAGRAEYDLKPFFHLPPDNIETTCYRQEVMQDVAHTPVLASIQSFSKKMQLMREQNSRIKKLHYQLQKERVFLDAIAFYCDAVTALAKDLSTLHLESRGLTEFREYVGIYASSDVFERLKRDMELIVQDLSSIEYELHIHNGSITVNRRGDEQDYSAAIRHSFARFKQGDVKSYEFKLPNYPEMNHIEAGILDFVAKLFPQVFSRLSRYYSEHQHYLDAVIARWDREIQFYVCYLEYIRPLLRRGLEFCYPCLLLTSKAVQAKRTFDIALAKKLTVDDAPIVTNGFELNDLERIFVVTGPNQGGKTTFARMFGQLHYLGRLGLPVPGTDAKLFFYKQLLTQFEKEENIDSHRGKLEDEILRMHDLIDRATSRSIVILNEVFSSTTFHDALLLARKVLEKLVQLDVLCVCVTFIDELSTVGPATVSLVSTVAPDDPTIRTFQIIRKVADAKSYAASIADKYRVSYQTLKERLSP